MKFYTLPCIEALKEFLHYDPSTGIFTRLKTTGSRAIAGTTCNSTAGNGYLQISIKNRHYLQHRLAWLYMTGDDPGSLEVDHINRIKTDNRFSNLRLVTSQINKLNSGMRSHNTSGLRGVSWCKTRRKWRVSLSNMGKHVYLGHYVDAEEAKLVYDKAVTALHGNYAMTNALLSELMK